MNKMSNLNALFNPKSIAVVGASQDPDKLGYVLLKNIRDYNFQGKVYPVNPKANKILGLKAFPKISSVPDKVDLALLSIPSHLVLAVAEECSEYGVKSIVILSSGFREAGADGEQIQERIRKICRSSGMRALGPNCMGIYNLSTNLNGTYFWELPRLRGNISFISQSGAYGGMLFNEIRQRQIGMSKFISIGNMVDINQADILRYLSTDKDTQAIALFIEDIQDGKEFLEVASEVSKVKPLVAFKAGRSEAGTRAAKSHTGAMAGSYQVYEAAFKQSGIVLTLNTEEFFDVTMALSSWHDCLPKNKNLAILTISGGPSVTASDTCEEVELGVPKFSEKTREKIRKYIPFFGADSNPVDMTPQMNPDNYQACVDTVFSLEEIGGVIAINVGLDRTEFASALVKANKKHGKPVVSFTIDTPELSRIFNRNGIPIYPTPERSVHAYNGLVKYRTYLERKKFKDKEQKTLKLSILLQQLSQEGKKTLIEYQCAKVLQEYGIPVCREFVAHNKEEAIQYAKDIGYPVVLKIHSQDILHKSETGGVFIRLKNELELKEAWQKIVKNFGQQAEVLIQEYVSPGVELIIGGKRDPVFGPAVLLGVGGVLTEVLKDISLRICPLDKGEAIEMIQELKAFPILRGYRGKAGCDTEVLAEVLLKVSHLLLSNSQIKELDINPLIAKEERLVSVDALMVLEQ
jgi:acetyl coenzyme A synthetase (ADP forming)-like protein